MQKNNRKTEFSRLTLPIDVQDIYIRSVKGKEFDTQNSSGIINMDRHEFRDSSYKFVSEFGMNTNISSTLQNNKEININSKNRQLRLLDWFDIPKQEQTEETMQEFMALHLRNSIGPRSFYKSDKSMKTPPIKFSFGRIVEDKMSVNSSTEKFPISGAVRRKTGSSFVRSLLKDAGTQQWANRKYTEIQKTKLKGAKKWYSRQLLKRKRY